ncbi:MAG: bifunctional diaminohydroxyphosphoribosylaminopyrimidine deaminase/5-amino-6-(5-phosphoribosylamino)uracil reductase RibD [Actinomycetota bacterium]|nr:bifunctional diaminohydroxyphosphoribosylaminopyrimidine deaminase/5-amino-6-(5-phosphoribosylamino)uracil reductase RibD [Actinomycetota bacterium]
MKYMRNALELAARGRGRTHPNPMVGAVVVKNGKVLGKGYHKGPGTPHAEVVALREAGKGAKGAELYVNLEPCNHHGNTPPCCDAILRAGIARVVIADGDPNPSVKGGGMERLERCGIEVECGIMRNRARDLNAAYRMLVIKKRPLVHIKVAATADAKVAARGGASRWITGEEARKMAHAMRRESDAIMVGRGTVDVDDPELTVRMVRLRGAKPPLRVVVDSRLSISAKSRLAGGGEPRVIVASTADHDCEKAELLRRRGVEIVQVAEADGRVDLESLLELLAGKGVAHLLVEGGPTLVTSFLELGLADRLSMFIAPRVFGDSEARSWVEGRTVEDPELGVSLLWRKASRVGDDLLLEADILGGEG